MNINDPRYLSKVSGQPNLILNQRTGAILNTDNAALAAHKKQKEIFLKTKQNEEKINKMESELKELSGNVAKILEILTEKKE